MKSLVLNVLFVMRLLLLAPQPHAQSALKFDKRFVESEDKWVALRGKPGESYSYGFIYLDLQAGFTMQAGGSFTIDAQGKYIPTPLQQNVKVRLQPNGASVAFIPPDKLAELGVTPVPDWLKIYKGDTATAGYFYRRGFAYNAWDYPMGALRLLKKAYQLDPKLDNLGTELGYTYNAIGQYNNASETLRAAKLYSSDKCYFYKELSYAQIYSRQLAEAAQTAQEGIAACGDRALQSEMAYNIAYQYHRLKDQANFELWAKETEKWAAKGDRFMVNLDKMRRNEI